MEYRVQTSRASWEGNHANRRAGAAAASATLELPSHSRLEILQQMTQKVADDPAAIRASRRGYRVAKRALDVAVSAVLLVLCAPLFVVIAAAIALDSPGPVFFRQERVGQGGRVFRMWKFRSMVDGVDLLDAPLHKRTDDPRVTRVGRFLRRTSLDELPQLINVLLGEMSLVGPRPEIVEIVLRHYEPWQYRRFLVPQGMTGWGRKLLREHTADDLYYIARASFWFDLKILVMTVRAVLRRDGAF